MPPHILSLVPGPSVLAYAGRERSRDLLKRAFPRRRGKLTLARTPAEFAAVFRHDLVDAAIVDVAQPTEETWKAAALARCAGQEFADLLAEGMDDAALRELVMPQSFTLRFGIALQEAHRALGLDSALQQRAWWAIVAQGGRPVRTDAIAKALTVTREHLSRSFAAEGSPNLKRIIDLVRLIAAAELAKNPGYDVADVARVLEFASPSHLTSTSQRLLGVRSASLAGVGGGGPGL